MQLFSVFLCPHFLLLPLPPTLIHFAPSHSLLLRQKTHSCLGAFALTISFPWKALVTDNHLHNTYLFALRRLKKNSLTVGPLQEVFKIRTQEGQK